MKTVYQAFNQSAARYPENAFLCVPPLSKRSYYPDGFEITYREAAQEIEQLKSV